MKKADGVVKLGRHGQNDAMTGFLDRPDGGRLAFEQVRGSEPTVVFLGGFASDMTGSKASHLDRWARDNGREFLRFDYSGHGKSSGNLQQGCVSDWAADAAAVIDARTKGKLVLVGSSMGGWIMLLLARTVPERVAGLVGIATAPDFTEDMLAALSPAERQRLDQTGKALIDEGEGEFEVWRRLLEDPGALVLNRDLDLPFPVRLLQGTADTVVPVSKAMQLLEHASGPDIRLTLVKGADHRFCGPAELDLIVAAIGEVGG